MAQEMVTWEPVTLSGVSAVKGQVWDHRAAPKRDEQQIQTRLSRQTSWRKQHPSLDLSFIRGRGMGIMF